MKVQQGNVVVSQQFDQPRSVVWDAITNVAEMRKWYFDNIPDFRAERGFSTQFLVKTEQREFLHLWQVKEVVEQQLLIYDWQYENYAGAAFVKFELFDMRDKTQLLVSFVVTKDFSDDISEFTRESCLGGWTYFINNSLKEYLS